MLKETRIITADAPAFAYWGDVWRHRDLVAFLALRDILVRYKQTVVGVAWAVLRPLATLLVYTFVFGKIAQLPSNGLPYALVVFTGLLPWQLFSLVFAAVSESLVANAPLVSFSRGNSLEIKTNRVGSRPVQAGKCLRSIVWSSSPLIDKSDSTMAALSGRLESRASGKIATGFPIKGARPNGRASVAKVGLATLFAPTSALSTRAIVPRPDRLGPTIMSIFCWRVSAVSK